MSIRRAGLSALHQRPAGRQLLLLLPGGGWLALFFAVPLAIMTSYAFRPRHMLGGVYPGWTLSAIERLADPLYIHVVWRSVVISTAATVLALVFAYPMALTIMRATRWRSLLIFLVVLPFWTSFLVRTYATIFMIRDTGMLNQLLISTGLRDTPIHLLYTPGAVLFGLITGFIPFMVLPIYSSLEKIDPALLEAAEALGASEWRRFIRVTWPLSLPGVVAGSVLVFVPALGSFLTSDLLGGAKVALIGNLVQDQFTSARNWPFGSALSLLLLAMVLVGMLWRVYAARDERAA